MTKEEAIRIAKSRPSNNELTWAIYKWSNGYAIAPPSFRKRNPHIEYILIKK